MWSSRKIPGEMLIFVLYDEAYYIPQASIVFGYTDVYRGGLALKRHYVIRTSGS